MALPSDEVLSIWNQIMKYQVDFSFPLEFPVYLTLNSWLTADRVLDLGSGDGYYAAQLATFFPDKTYTCIDIDDRAIEAGNEQFGDFFPRPLSFETADILTYRGDFPVAIARLLVQHLEAPEDLFRAAPNFLQPGGRLIVVDSNDQLRLFWPLEKCRWIENFFASFSAFQPGRMHSTSMPGLAEDYGFKVEVNHTLVIPSTIPTYKDVFYRSYQLFFKIVQDHYGMEFDYKSLFDQLDEWAQEEASYAQIGVNVCSYRLNEVR